jgi:hypothetical protein
MTILEELRAASPQMLARPGGTASAPPPTPETNWDNRPSWDSGPRWDSRPTWDNWSK